MAMAFGVAKPRRRQSRAVLRGVIFVFVVIVLFILMVFALMQLLITMPIGSNSPLRIIPGVEEISNENLYTFCGAGNYLLLEFYASWCGHCRDFTPIYEKLAVSIAADESLKNKVVIAKVNGDRYGKLTEKFGIEGYPTILLFQPYSCKDGALVEGETERAILRFLHASVK